MAVNQKVTGRASSLPAGLAMGAAVNLLITGTMTALLAWFVNKEIVQWEIVGYGVLIMVMMSSFLGAVMAYHKIRRQRLLVCVMSGGIYYAMLLIITALFFGGQYEAVAVTALLVVGGVGCAAIGGPGRGRNGKTAKVKKHYR